MKLRKSAPAGSTISLVSMIDVLMILLIFFMVTSTYLNLSMIPVAERPSGTVTPGAAAGQSDTILVQLSGDGSVRFQGRIVDLATLQQEVAGRLAAQSDLVVAILPSGNARTQALAAVMDALSTTGVSRLRILSGESGS